MHHQRHDARQIGRVGIDLLELVERAFAVFQGGVLLNRDHGDIVDFLRVGQVEDRPAARLEPDRLIVEHPVGDVVVSFLGEQVGSLPGLGEARPEPAARRLAGRLGDHLGVFLMSARSLATFCMLRWVKPCPMNSQPRSHAARTIGG